MHVIKIIVDFDIINHLVRLYSGWSGADPGRIFCTFFVFFAALHLFHLFFAHFAICFLLVYRDVFSTISDCTNAIRIGIRERAEKKVQLHFICVMPRNRIHHKSVPKVIRKHSSTSKRTSNRTRQRGKIMCRNVV